MLSHDFIQTRLKYAGVKDKAPVIDVSRAGYCKVQVLSNNTSIDMICKDIISYEHICHSCFTSLAK